MLRRGTMSLKNLFNGLTDKKHTHCIKCDGGLLENY